MNNKLIENLSLSFEKLSESEFEKLDTIQAELTQVTLKEKDLARLSELILVLPEKVQFVFFAKYQFELSKEATEELYNVSFAKGILNYYGDILSKAFELKDFETISEESYKKATQIALKASDEKIEKVKKIIPMYKRMIRNIAAALLIITVGLGTVLSVSAEAREFFISIFFEIFPTYSVVELHTENEDILAEDIVFEYIPEGFELTRALGEYDIILYEYKKEDEEFNIFISNSKTSSTAVDTEGAEIIQFELFENPAYKWSTENGNYLNFQYSDVLIIIYSELDLDELLKIAESIGIKNNLE